MNNRRKIFAYASLLFLLFLALVACTPRLGQVEARYLSDEEMGILPSAFGVTTRDVPRGRSGCNDQVNYEIDTSRLQDYPMRYLRINMHWMNSEDGSQNIPEEEAVAHSKRIVEAMNYALRKNPKMFLPIGNDTPVHPVNFRYVLSGRPDDPTDEGVYYHYDDSLYYYVHYRKKDSNLYDRTVIKKYGVQLDTVLNLFMLPHQPDSVKSKTYAAGNVGVALRNALKVAATFKENFEADSKNCHWGYRGVINHEVGHILSLAHAWGRGDGCEDTPVHSNRCFGRASGPGCDTLMSNNLMDYSSLQLAWTPCQISKVHRRFSNPKYLQRKFLEPRWCTLDPDLDITVEGEVDWSCMRDLHGNLTIANGARLTIRCRTSVPENGTVTIQSGGELIIDGGLLHQDCGGLWQGIVVEKEGELEGKLTILNDGQIQDVGVSD
ncbi:MAG: hypothetical protein AAFZ63_23380 [Bacteroidota bacterium]